MPKTVPAMRRLGGQGAALLLLAACAGAPAAAQELKALLEETRDSVVLLSVFDAAGREVGSGTGFLVKPGIVATNHHVVSAAHRVAVTLSRGETANAEGVIAEDGEADLALLRVPGLDARPLRLAASDTVEPGDRVVVLGNPLGLAGTVSEGIVAALRPNGLGPEVRGFENTPLLQITAPISPGSSGSPVLDAQGRVVGVAVSQFLFGQNLNFAVPSNSLSLLLANADLEDLQRPLGSGAGAGAWSIARNLAISAAFFVAVLLAFRLMRD